MQYHLEMGKSLGVIRELELGVGSKRGRDE